MANTTAHVLTDELKCRQIESSMKPNKNKGKTQFVGFVGFVGPIDLKTPIAPPKRSIETLQDQKVTYEYTHTHISSLFLLGFMVVNSSVEWLPTNSDVSDELKIGHHGQDSGQDAPC